MSPTEPRPLWPAARQGSFDRRVRPPQAEAAIKLATAARSLPLGTGLWSRSKPLACASIKPIRGGISCN